MNPDVSFKVGPDGNPVLKEDGSTATTFTTHPTVGQTAGGAFLTYAGSRTGVVTIFPDIAKVRRFKSAGTPTNPSLTAITIHELLDHGLDFIRTGNNNKSSGPSINNVTYQNNALKIIKSTTRVGHDNQ
ncbi:hypothetical protein [Flavobacterium rhizosphaerae]|uniref:Uncharacterized protein n=1 Tax=Flavobacterium rhizosphaerae TaxID=3163298 RepID=A0ABW8YZC6_9FLAO